MAVLGLVIVGTAGAFAYRAMFGSVAFPSLPPIIKASIGPNKIMPNDSAAQADNAAQSSAGNQSGADKLVSREEQPVNMEPPKAGPRVVATIPIGAAPMPLSSTAAASAPASPDVAAPSFGTASASALDAASAEPAPAPMPTATSPAASTAAPALPASEPKKVRTVLIHTDQAAGAQPAAPTPRNARSATASRNQGERLSWGLSGRCKRTAIDHAGGGGRGGCSSIGGSGAGGSSAGRFGTFAFARSGRRARCGGERRARRSGPGKRALHWRLCRAGELAA